MIQFDEHIFQMGGNHQLDVYLKAQTSTNSSGCFNKLFHIGKWFCFWGPLIFRHIPIYKCLKCERMFNVNVALPETNISPFKCTFEKMIFLLPRYVSFLEGNPWNYACLHLPGGPWTPLAAAAARCHARMKRKKKTALSAWLRRGGL